MSKEPKMKKCRHCKTEIDAKASICHNCKKKQGNPVVGFIVLIAIIGIIASAVNSSDSNSGSTSTKTASTESKESEIIEYTSISVAELDEVLNTNALKAKETYKGAYIEITGKLSNIDASGKYITLKNDEMFDVYGVQCYIKGDDQKKKVMDMVVDEHYTIRVKIKDVGEVMGYSADIMEFVD
jgi:RNA polymerase subunit RPABC4/transcription elongation factor Spt4